MTQSIKDPVCGMEVKPSQAATTAALDGQTFYFCSQACYRTFVANPPRYAEPAGRQEDGSVHHGHA